MTVFKHDKEYKRVIFNIEIGIAEQLEAAKETAKEFGKKLDYETAINKSLEKFLKKAEKKIEEMRQELAKGKKRPSQARALAPQGQEQNAETEISGPDELAQPGESSDQENLLNIPKEN